MTRDAEPRILVEVEGPIAELRLANPPLNLLTTGMFHTLRHRLSELAQSTVRVVIVAGQPGGPFSAGSDLSEFDEIRLESANRKTLVENLALMDLQDFPVPTIAAIEEYALGGGLELALACDLRIAGQKARLALPEARLGGLASNGAQRLTALLGPGTASQLLFLAEELEGEDATSLGLTNWAAPDGKVLPHARDIARRIVELSPNSIRLAKQIIRNAAAIGRDTLVESVRAQEAVFTSAELTEGVNAFFEKRTPTFEDSSGSPGAGG